MLLKEIETRVPCVGIVWHHPTENLSTVEPLRISSRTRESDAKKCYLSPGTEGGRNVSQTILTLLLISSKCKALCTEPHSHLRWLTYKRNGCQSMHNEVNAA